MAFSKNMDDRLEQFGDDATSSGTINRDLIEAVFQYLSEKKYPSGSDYTSNELLEKRQLYLLFEKV